MQDLNCAIRRLLGCVAICVALLVVASGFGAGSGWSKTSSKPPAAPIPEKTELGGKPMDFTVIRLSSGNCEPNCPEWIAAEGEITVKTPAKLARLLANPEYRKLPITLNSPGGAVYAAMDMGQMIRKYGMSTAVAWSNTRDCSDLNKTPNCLPAAGPVHLGYLNEYNAYCNSACSWMQLSGVVRIVGAGAELGLHQPHADYQPWIDHYWDTWRMVNGKKHIISHKFVKRTYLAQKHEVGVQKNEMQKYLSYIRQMGGSPDILVEMNKASPKDLNAFNHGSARLKELGLVTDETLNANALVSADHCKTFGKLSSNCVTLTPQQLASLQPKPLPTPATAPAPAGTSDQAPASTPMTFTVMRLMSDACTPRCVEWIAADGNITSDTPSKLQKLLENEQNRKLPVILNSAGGNGDAAMALGRVIHKYHMDTAVAATSIKDCAKLANCPPQGSGAQPGLIFTTPSHCDDACTLVLLSGTLRIAEDDAHISVRPAASDLPFSDSQRAKYKAYLKEINVTSGVMAEYDYGSYHPSNEIAGSKRQDLGLISNSKIYLSRLVSGGHCDNANTFVSNCILEKVAPLAKAAAAPPSPRPSPTPPGESGAMTFTVMRLASSHCEPRCAEWIAAAGTITSQTPDNLVSLLSNPENRKLPILLQSHGGDLDAALAMGRMIWHFRMNTAVAISTISGCSNSSNNDRNCVLGIGGPARSGVASATASYCDDTCPLVLMAGVTHIAEKEASIGLHQLSFSDDNPFYAYMADIGSSFAIMDEMNKATTTQLRQVPDIAIREIFQLVTDRKLVLNDLIGPDHCHSGSKFQDNCVLKTKEPHKTAAP